MSINADTYGQPENSMPSEDNSRQRHKEQIHKSVAINTGDHF